jgi:hypothetical protein
MYREFVHKHHLAHIKEREKAEEARIISEKWESKLREQFYRYERKKIRIFSFLVYRCPFCKCKFSKWTEYHYCPELKHGDRLEVPKWIREK